MKIQITMISGKKYEFENLKYNDLNEWIKGNFKGQGDWFKISPECDFVINIGNIEEIKVTQSEDLKK